MLRRPWRRLGVVTAATAATVAMLTGIGTSASAAASPTTSCTSMTLAQVQSRVLADVNAARKKAGVPALTPDTKMNAVASTWAQKQAVAKTMSHNPSYSTQIPAGWSSAAENVAYGYAPASVTKAWLDSAGHRKNIETKAFTHTGIGVACDAAGRPYYSQVFGAYKTAPATAVKPAAAKASPYRLSGSDRFATSAAISRASFSPGVSVVYLTSGRDFPDALSGVSAAGEADSPVLLVSPNEIPAAIQTELKRLRPGRIVVLGGTSVVSSATLKQAQKYTSGSVTRVSGADRFATSAAISAKSFDGGTSVVYVAAGSTFPDALSGGAAAASSDAPVLLVKTTSVPDSVRAELARLHPDRVVVLGGPGAVSAKVLADVGSYAAHGATRLSGSDRYATSAAVSKATFAPGVDIVYLASGRDFPDALSGGPAAALKDGPVLLTTPGELPAVIKAELARLKPKRVMILGGDSVVSDAVLAAATRYATG